MARAAEKYLERQNSFYRDGDEPPLPRALSFRIDAGPGSTLRFTPGYVQQAHKRDWRSLLRGLS